MTHSFEALFNNLAELSEINDDIDIYNMDLPQKKAFLTKFIAPQWKFIEMEEYKNNCICGVCIMYNFIIRNEHNSNETIVGSKCILNFNDEETTEMSKSILLQHKAKQNGTKTRDKKPKFKLCSHVDCGKILHMSEYQKHFRDNHINADNLICEVGKYPKLTLKELVLTKRNYVKTMLINCKKYRYYKELCEVYHKYNEKKKEIDEDDNYSTDSDDDSEDSNSDKEETPIKPMTPADTTPLKYKVNCKLPKYPNLTLKELVDKNRGYAIWIKNNCLNYRYRTELNELLAM